MKAKNFLASGVVGGLVYFVLGYLFYGLLLKDLFQSPDMDSEQLVMIFLGCMTYGLFISYVYNKWAQITTMMTGAKAGIIIGLFLALFFNFFNTAMNPEATLEMFAADTVVTMITTAITGGVIGMINGKMG